MAAPKSVWGLDIGQCALKAIKLREVNGQLQAEAFDTVEHPNVLSEPDVNRKELISKSLEEFLSRNDVSDSDIAIAVPGQTSFTRFVKLPLVEAKKIPELVRFEAEQQIPFDIDDVVWRWQGFPEPDSPDLSVGLFAMKRQDVYTAMQPFTDEDVSVDVVQMKPLALYNFMKYDRQVAEEGATLLVDIGADGTDLVVADGTRLWTRTIQLGGNDFTEALVSSFNLSFEKAEKLKRTAATSKYARQVFQSMRPVFADLVQEIQRSIGYYTSLRRDAKFVRIVGVGSGFRLPGLQKFLEQNLNTPVARVDSFNALQSNSVTSSPKFTENLPSFAVAYGLAVQGLELADVDSNLLPDEIASIRLWRSKRPWFIAASVLLVASMLMWAWREHSDYSVLRTDRGKSEQLLEVERTIATFQKLKKDFDETRAEVKGNLSELQATVELNKYNKFWPAIQTTIFESISSVATDLREYNAGNKDVSKGKDALRVITLQSMTSKFVDVPESPEKARELLTADNKMGFAASTTTSRGMNTGGGMDMGMDMGMSMNMDMGMGGAPQASSGNVSTKDAVVVTFTGRSLLDKSTSTTLISDVLNRCRTLAEERLKGKAELMAGELIQFNPTSNADSGRRGPVRQPGNPGMDMGMGMGMGMGMQGAGPRGQLGQEDPLFAVDTSIDFREEDISESQTFVVGWVFKIIREDSTAGN